MRGRRALGAAIAAWCVTSVAVASSAAVARADAWLGAEQRPDGSFAQLTNADYVAEAAGALAATGGDASVVSRALALVSRTGPDRARASAGAAGRLALGLIGAGADPRRFGGFDYVAQIASFADPVTGAYDTRNRYADALAVLALRSAGATLGANAITYLELGQCSDGGYAATGCSGPSDVDTTALVITSLVRAGVAASEAPVARARSYLASVADASGGFGARGGEPVNANSTGLALSAIALLGERPDAAPWRKPGGTPRAAVLGLQLAGGGFRYLGTDRRANEYATVQAIAGVAGLAYPLHPAPREPARTTSTSARSAVPTGGSGSAVSASPSPTISARNDVRSGTSGATRALASQDPTAPARPSRSAPLAAASLLALGSASAFVLVRRQA